MLPSSLGQYRRKARCDVRHFLDRIHTKRNEIKKALPSQVLQEACDIADEKNLCIVSGLHSCYHAGYAETIQPFITVPSATSTPIRYRYPARLRSNFSRHERNKNTCSRANGRDWAFSAMLRA